MNVEKANWRRYTGLQVGKAPMRCTSDRLVSRGVQSVSGLAEVENRTSEKSERDAMAERRSRRICCFDDQRQQREVDASFSRRIAELQKKTRAMFVSEENIYRFNHGRRWVRSAHDDHEPRMYSISAEWAIPNQEIVDNDLGLIERCLTPVSENMSRQLSENMYGVITEGATRVGNVTDAREIGSFAASFLDMLRKIEFGVDRNGEISLPQMHLGPDMFTKAIAELGAQPPEFAAEVERLKAEKSKLAREREAERKAKFMRLPA